MTNCVSVYWLREVVVCCVCMHGTKSQFCLAVRANIVASLLDFDYFITRLVRLLLRCCVAVYHTSPLLLCPLFSSSPLPLPLPLTLPITSQFITYPNQSRSRGEKEIEKEKMYISPARPIGYVFPTFMFYYPFGNTPPCDLFATIPPNTHNSRILSVGCGDIRSVLFSLWLRGGMNNLFFLFPPPFFFFSFSSFFQLLHKN
jgi:hypothetical protein